MIIHIRKPQAIFLYLKEHRLATSHYSQTC